MDSKSKASYISDVSKEIGCGSPVKARGKSRTRKFAAFLFSVPVYGGGNGELFSSQVTLRVPLSSTPITRCRPTWKLFGSCSQGTTGALHA